jgi:hypothetical protein
LLEVLQVGKIGAHEVGDHGLALLDLEVQEDVGAIVVLVVF